MAGRERPRAGSTSVRRGMWVRRGEVRRRACGGRRSPAERAEFFRLPPPEKVARASKTRRRRPDRAQAHRLHRATDCCCNRAAVVSALPAAVDVPRSRSLHSNAEPRGPQIGSVRDQPHTLFSLPTDPRSLARVATIRKLGHVARRNGRGANARGAGGRPFDGRNLHCSFGPNTRREEQIL